jgi:hypothetical protein
MTPKERAKDLAYKLAFIANAIHLVNDILETTKEVIDRPEYYGVVYNKYWLEVKTELEKL